MRRACSVAIVAIAACLGCTQDFDALLPQQDAAAAPPTDVSDAVTDVEGEVGCEPDAACLATAGACGDSCASTRAACESGCSTGACRKKCRDDEAACEGTCVDACVTCAASAGCEARPRCTAEVN